MIQTLCGGRAVRGGAFDSFEPELLAAMMLMRTEDAAARARCGVGGAPTCCCRGDTGECCHSAGSRCNP
eukprot:253126-Prymnesium_polylepis.1